MKTSWIIHYTHSFYPSPDSFIKVFLFGKFLPFSCLKGQELKKGKWWWGKGTGLTLRVSVIHYGTGNWLRESFSSLSVDHLSSEKFLLKGGLWVIVQTSQPNRFVKKTQKWSHHSWIVLLISTRGRRNRRQELILDYCL